MGTAVTKLPAGWSVEMQGLSSTVSFEHTDGMRLLWCDGVWQSGTARVMATAPGVPSVATMADARRIGTEFIVKCFADDQADAEPTKVARRKAECGHLAPLTKAGKARVNCDKCLATALCGHKSTPAGHQRRTLCDPCRTHALCGHSVAPLADATKRRDECDVCRDGVPAGTMVRLTDGQVGQVIDRSATPGGWWVTTGNAIVEMNTVAITAQRLGDATADLATLFDDDLADIATMPAPRAEDAVTDIPAPVAEDHPAARAAYRAMVEADERVAEPVNVATLAVTSFVGAGSDPRRFAERAEPVAEDYTDDRNRAIYADGTDVYVYAGEQSYRGVTIGVARTSYDAMVQVVRAENGGIDATHNAVRLPDARQAWHVVRDGHIVAGGGGIADPSRERAEELAVQYGGTVIRGLPDEQADQVTPVAVGAHMVLTVARSGVPAGTVCTVTALVPGSQWPTVQYHGTMITEAIPLDQLAPFVAACSRCGTTDGRLHTDAAGITRCHYGAGCATVVPVTDAATAAVKRVDLDRLSRDERTRLLRQAHETLTRFAPGDRATLRDERGRERAVTITRGRLSDGAYGSWESYQVGASLGVGRYTWDVTCWAVASGTLTLTPATLEPTKSAPEPAAAPDAVAVGGYASWQVRDEVHTVKVCSLGDRYSAHASLMATDGFTEFYPRGLPAGARPATAEEIEAFERIRAGRLTPVAYE